MAWRRRKAHHKRTLPPPPPLPLWLLPKTVPATSAPADTPPRCTTDTDPSLRSGACRRKEMAGFSFTWRILAESTHACRRGVSEQTYNLRDRTFPLPAHFNDAKKQKQKNMCETRPCKLLLSDAP